MGKLINLASALLARHKIMSKIGMTYEGKRDLYQALGYKRELVYQDFWERYRRGGIAKQVVEAFPAATWRGRPRLEGGVRLQKAWERLEQIQPLFRYLDRVDRISGIGRYGVLLVGVRGQSNLALPLRKIEGASPDDLIYLSIYSEQNASITEWETDPASPRFGLPKMYILKLSSEASPGAARAIPGGSARVHYTRLIHVAEGVTEDETFGTPRLEPVWNYLDDLDKVVGGSSEAVWRTVDRGIQFNLDKDAEFGSDTDEADLKDEIEEYMHGLKRYVLTQGIDAKVLGSEITDPRGAFGVLAQLVSATTGIPMRMLFGSERGQLASQQDEKSFNARLRERQLNYAEPGIFDPFVDLLMRAGLLPEGAYTVTWPDNSTLTDKERADVAARMGQAARSFALAVKEGPGLYDIEEVKDKYLGLKGAGSRVEGPSPSGPVPDSEEEDEGVEEEAPVEEEEGDEDATDK